MAPLFPPTALLRPLALALVVSLIVSGCSQPRQKPKVRIASGPPLAWTMEPKEKRIQRSSSELYVIKPGDTLIAVAMVHEVEPEDLAAWNQIKDPDLLFVGQKLRLKPPVEHHGGPKPSTTTTAAAIQPPPKVVEERSVLPTLPS
ncbi:MAG: LysM peptidoglycan-binding domain-containing protein, partial [Magnetococcales bacterium]|nr:LysM peptidoglycan-binding domain-containing protein [Magnetococcales bacterium]